MTTDNLTNEELALYGGLYEANVETLNKASTLAKTFRETLSDLHGALTIPKHNYDLLLTLPRRRAGNPENRTVANLVASLLYPCNATSLAAIIRYEEDVKLVRQTITKQRADELAKFREASERNAFKERILMQGPWNPELDPVSLRGAPSLPMPVDISTEEALKPFFSHLELNGALDSPIGKKGQEPYYATPLVEFEKGVLYADARMDLCKMVLGPTHIERLLDTLEKNEFVRHFLLGNNIIGPVGAERISKFCADERFRDRIETWYLAGNCIDASGFRKLVNAWKESKVITNIWLKRNPLMMESADAIIDLILNTPHLRTLDLDQTELGDEGVSHIFTALAAHDGELSLRNIYLNATGISHHASTAIASFLSSPHCRLESLYISNNPIGPSGALALAKGLLNNTSLLRLSLSSCGLSTPTASSIFQALTGHPILKTLEIGQQYATKDLEQRYNYLTDDSVRSICTFMQNTPALSYLGLGLMDISRASWHKLMNTALGGECKLIYFEAKALRPMSVGQVQKMEDTKQKHSLLRTCTLRAQEAYGNPKMSYQDFFDSELRWLRSPKDVRLIDSVYRNRDAGMARRGEKVLEKWWGDNDVLNGVMAGQKEIKVRMCPMKAAALERNRRAYEEREMMERKLKAAKEMMMSVETKGIVIAV